MLVGVPKEIKDNEYRVGLVSSSVRDLTSNGHHVLVEQGAGGFVCDPARREDFVARLLTLLRDGDLRARFGARNRERADRLYRWDRCVEATRRVYEDAVEAWRRLKVARR